MERILCKIKQDFAEEYHIGKIPSRSLWVSSPTLESARRVAEILGIQDAEVDTYVGWNEYCYTLCAWLDVFVDDNEDYAYIVEPSMILDLR